MNATDDSIPALDTVRAFLNPDYEGRIVMLGIGNRLRGDDGAGPVVIDKLKEKYDSSECSLGFSYRKMFLDAGESPEDWFIRILDSKPEVVIVVDAMDFQAEPGSIAVCGSETLPDSFCFSTHRLPLKSLISLWEQGGIKTIVLAIQPENICLGEEITPHVKTSVDLLIQVLTHWE